MAIRFDSASDYLSRTANLINYNAAYTVMFWAYITTDRNDYSHFWAACDQSTEASLDFTNSDFLGTGADGTTFRGGSVIGGTAGYPSGSALSTGTWYNLAARRTSATLWEGLINGAVDISDTTNIGGRAAVAGEFMGKFNGGFQLDGRVAHYKSWGAALTDAEVRAEMRTAFPIRLENINTSARMFKGTTERLFDEIHGYNWTANGALTDEDGPFIAISSRPHRRTFYTSSGGGGGSPAAGFRSLLGVGK